MTAHESKSLLPALSNQAAQMFAPLHREIDRVFAEFNHGVGALDLFGLSPKMDFSESKSAVELAVELPGLQRDDISITVDGDLLVISGEKKLESEKKDKDFHVTERQYGAFSRSVRLPHRVDADKITAELQNGVLKVTAPKIGPDTAKRIPVQAAKA